MSAKFFQLLRYSINDNASVPDGITGSDFPYLFQISKEQALLGVIFNGINRLPKSMLPDKNFIMKWYSVSRRIAAQNTIVNKNAVTVANMFRKKGFRTCLLKGQGNALLYPDPYMRIPGDIDIWVEGGDRKVLALVNKLAPGTKHCYHHAEFPQCGGTEVEVHYRPSFMNNMMANRRLQRFFADNAPTQFANSTALPDNTGHVCVPTAAFNRIFQMIHISNHFFNEGIGLRQLLDYYFVLKQGFTEEERQADCRTLKACGMYNIAAAVMYVEKEVFGLDEDSLIVPADERRGKVLLEEIMRSGNFGLYDERLDKYRGSQLKQNVQRLVRDARFASLFPGECLWEPAFRLFHFGWRITH